MKTEILKRDKKQIKAIIKAIEKLQGTDCLHDSTIENVNFDLLDRALQNLKHSIGLKTTLNH